VVRFGGQTGRHLLLLSFSAFDPWRHESPFHPQPSAALSEKDSKRFADSGGWGWGAFNYNAASGTFSLATVADNPPQGNDAKCGFGCHTEVKNRDYVFTE
jgi:hypothetical protein